MVLSRYKTTVNGNSLPDYTTSYPRKIEGMKLTTHLHLALRLIVHGAATPVHDKPS